MYHTTSIWLTMACSPPASIHIIMTSWTSTLKIHAFTCIYTIEYRFIYRCMILCSKIWHTERYICLHYIWREKMRRRALSGSIIKVHLMTHSFYLHQRLSFTYYYIGCQRLIGLKTRPGPSGCIEHSFWSVEHSTTARNISRIQHHIPHAWPNIHISITTSVWSELGPRRPAYR